MCCSCRDSLGMEGERVRERERRAHAVAAGRGERSGLGFCSKFRYLAISFGKPRTGIVPPVTS